jgi:hypothetical protein
MGTTAAATAGQFHLLHTARSGGRIGASAITTAGPSKLLALVSSRPAASMTEETPCG